MLDVVGVVLDYVDPVNGVLYIAEGDYKNAGLSFTGTLPSVGVLATGKRVIKASSKVFDAEKTVSKYSLKKIKHNKSANEVAKRAGYDGAKFNMMYDTKTGEIVLVAIKDSNVKIPTGLYK